MSTTLTLIDAGWESARATAQRGQPGLALDRLARLLARPDVPPALAAAGHRLAGELALDLGRYATARGHLRAAAKLEPGHAGTYYLAARAWEEDPDGCDRRAALRFKRAAALDAANPLYRAAFGRAAARCGKVRFGTREMLAATELAPGDVAVARVAVHGLLEVGRAAEARQVIARARFLCPGNHELAALWERLKFETARLDQKAGKRDETRENARYAQDAHFATDGDRVTLPFVRLAAGTAPAKGATGRAGGTIRHDAASFPRPHFLKRNANRRG